MGMPLAAVALHFGANDVQGTVVREEIFKAAGGRTGTEQKVEELVRFVTRRRAIPCSVTPCTTRERPPLDQPRRHRGERLRA